MDLTDMDVYHNRGLGRFVVHSSTGMEVICQNTDRITMDSPYLTPLSPVNRQEEALEHGWRRG
jgi:hypothetical protein